jgi:CelD/BcsL family acetyltransferase involved in cellulose biosynthesis
MRFVATSSPSTRQIPIPFPESDLHGHPGSHLRSAGRVRPASSVETIVERVQGDDEFTALAGEWQQLLANSQADTLFLTWEWLFTWWKHFGSKRQLHLISVRSEDRTLIALVPLALRPRQPARLLPFRSLEFLGTGIAGSDYLDIIVRNGQEDRVTKALADYLARYGCILELRQLPSQSTQTPRLADKLAERGWHVRHTTTDVCPYVDLRGYRWDSYLAGLGASHRQNVRRRLRNLHRNYKVTLERAETESGRQRAFDTLMSLHYKRWANRRSSDALDDPQLVAFHDEFSRIALERGWLRLYTLNLDGQPAASLYGFMHHNSFLFYQSGFDTAYGSFSVGLAMLALAIQAAMAEGAVEFDLLHGDETYKFLWTQRSRRIVRLDAYPGGVRGVVSERIMAMRRELKRIMNDSRERRDD